MAASRPVFALSVVLVAAPLSLGAQEAPKTEPPKPDKPAFHPGGPGGPAGSPPDWRFERRRESWTDWGHTPPPSPWGKLDPEAEADRKKAMEELAKLTADQQKEIWRTVVAVMNLSAEKQAELLTSPEERRAKVREEIDQKLKDFRVADDRKRAFVRKYFGGRRVIEEEIRKKSDAHRAELTAILDVNLKKMFDPNAPAVPAPDRRPGGAGGPGPGPGGPPNGRFEPRRESWTDWGRRGGPPQFPMGPEADAERQRAMGELAKLTPEQRGKLWRTVLAVIALPAEKKTELLANEEERKKQTHEELEQKLKEYAITDDKKKWWFMREYFGGRRQIEDKLRKEADQNRAERMAALDEELKKEFSPGGQNVLQVAPSPEAPPK
jgi:hypothetical protein